MKGILNLYKERGMSSAAVISAARGILGEKKIGHMGTLDPQGTGVLLAGVGKAARLFDFFLNKDKEYEAVFTFGYATDTLDGDGTVVEKTGNLPAEAEIINALPSFIGRLNQIPPLYSAKSVGGERAYKLARRGLTPELKPSAVTVYAFTLLSKEGENAYKFKIRCSAGTYIRSLCRDLAEKLGSLATMTAIHRSRAGNFTSDTAVTLERLRVLKETAIIPVEAALSGLTRRDFPPEEYQRILNGIKVDSPETPEPFTVYCNDELFGIGVTEDGKLRITSFLKD